MGMTSRDAFEITLRRLEETTALLQEERRERLELEIKLDRSILLLEERRLRINQVEENNRALEGQRDALVDERQKRIAADDRRSTILSRFYERAQAAQQWLDFYGRGRPAGARTHAQSREHAQSRAEALASAMQEAYEYCDQVPF